MRRFAVVTAMAAIAALSAACGSSGSTAATSTTSAPSTTSTTSAPSTPAQVVQTTYPSASLHSNRQVIVLLPPGYRSSQRYPVVEFLHGAPGGPAQMLHESDMITVSNRSKTPFIAVAPDGNGPVVPESDFANTSLQPMGTVTGPELRSWVDSHYPTDRTWYVTGFSSGGFGAAYLPTLSPGAYKAACPVSGSFTAVTPPFPDDGAFAGQSLAVRQAASPILHVSANGPRTLVVVGSADTEGLDQAHTYVAAMKAVGQSNKLIVNPGAHDVAVWSAGNRQCIGYFFPASGLPS